MASQLTLRWAVSAVAIPLVIGALWLGGWFLGSLVGLVAALGAREVYRLGRVQGLAPFDGMGAIAAAALVLCATWLGDVETFALAALTILSGLAVMAMALALPLRTSKGTPLTDIAVTVFGAMYTGLTLSAVILLYSLPTVDFWGPIGGSPWLGFQVVALPLAATWVGDSVAFFAGTAWGRAKIAPSISPNKSWVGSIAGLVGSAGATAIWFVLVQDRVPGLPIGSVGTAAVIGAMLGVGAQVGDFLESLLKREAGVKDSGTILPGHGGILDRLDALFFTGPLAFVTLFLMGRFG